MRKTGRRGFWDEPNRIPSGYMDLHQAYVQIGIHNSFPLSPRSEAGLVRGERLIGASDWTNVRRTLMSQTEVRVEGFWVDAFVHIGVVWTTISMSLTVMIGSRVFMPRPRNCFPGSSLKSISSPEMQTQASPRFYGLHPIRRAHAATSTASECTSVVARQAGGWDTILRRPDNLAGSRKPPWRARVSSARISYSSLRGSGQRRLYLDKFRASRAQD